MKLYDFFLTLVIIITILLTIGAIAFIIYYAHSEHVVNEIIIAYGG